ncbi:MAG: calcium-translocating P-type ATPase, PMCA-type [Clostridia bacterium]|nr:calcium-translocating P-type ATPase, PMCA-type [Clostridia bacterium]
MTKSIQDKAGRKFRVDISKGLSKSEVQQSRAKFGSNTITKSKRKPFLSKFISNLKDPIIKILIGALVINVAFMMKNINWPETIGIAFAVLIAALVSTISEHGSDAAFEKMNAKNCEEVIAFRDGRRKAVLDKDIVTGDIIFIGAGMSIPADCLIIRGEVSADESALTGESVSVKKRAAKVENRVIDLPFAVGASRRDTHLFKGCFCTKGECEALVLGVGDNTEYGKIAKELIREDEVSPLKERLTQLAKSVSKIGYAAAALIMAAYIFNAVVIDSSWNTTVILTRVSDLRFMFSTVLSSITLGVSVIVVAVPEGLPMMITVVLSSNMKRMLKSGVLVRKMVGIETAGAMNILFTDKTGTLTSGNMSVRKIIFDGMTCKDPKDVAKHPVFSGVIPLLTEGLIGSSFKTPTETALIKHFKPVSSYEKCTVIEKMKFDPDKKYSACVFESGGIRRCALLGAAEKLLDESRYYKASDGKIKLLDDATKCRLYDEIISETSASSRMLTLAEAYEDNREDIKCGDTAPLIFVAFISIRDELRHNIANTVKLAKSAGVQVVMMTGDNRDTARAIAAEAGIIDSSHALTVTGDEVRNMSDKELLSILPDLAVVSRALPSDKLRLVEISKKAGLVCGMTGDGINDAPSLKSADVGFAMGSGSDVAKEASDVVIANNSFEAITRAILYGRCIFESIRKFITFQLTMNLCALGVSLIGPFIGIDAPITVIQMLWVNIIMDTLGGLAFAGEVPLKEYMEREPIKRNEKILTRRMTHQILFLGTYTLALCIGFLKLPFVKMMIDNDSDVYYLTCFFALFIFCGIFNSFNARSPHGPLLSHISGNKSFITIIFIVASVQLAIIYLGGAVFRCTPLTRGDLILCCALSLSVIPADKIRKLLTRRKTSLG